MNDTNFKILLGVTESGVYHVYDTSSQDVIKMNSEQFKKEKHSIRCSDSSNRNDGTVAVLYQVQDNRFIVVNSYGRLHFRTFTEIKHSIKSYFNVLLEDNTLKLTDGKLLKANKYMEVITYIDMFQQNSVAHSGKPQFEIDKNTYDVTLKSVKELNSGVFDIPNFVKYISEKCFVDLIIRSITLGGHTKNICSKAFYNCDIDSVTIGGGNLKVQNSIFYICNIQKITLKEVFRTNIFKDCRIGTLDLSNIKAMHMNYNVFEGVTCMYRLITHIKLKTIDLDKIPETTREIYVSSKATKITNSSKYDINKLNADITSGKKELILRDYIK